MSSIKTAVALCAVGAEKVVSNEIKKLGLKVIEGGFGRVRFEADIPGLYRSLIGLRAADRLLLEAAHFEAADFDALFEGTRSIPWEDYIDPDLGIVVAKVRTNRSRLSAETSIQGIVHKAAAERLCKKRGTLQLPRDLKDAELRVYIEKDMASILLDLSGEPLFKRGYRAGGGGIAPLRETTAAALILHSLWRRKFPLYDPFCGSGTIAIEAAMYAFDIAPGIGRRFAIDKLLIRDRSAEHKAREEFLGKVDFSRLVRIYGSDSDAGAVSAARDNLERALGLVRVNNKTEPKTEFEKGISFEILPMEDAKPPVETGFIITNPPYGRRLGDAESAEKTYAKMRKLAQNFPGWKLAVITDNPGFESFFGKKASSCREISNGAVRSYFFSI